MKKVICKIEYDTEASELIQKKVFGVFGDPKGYEESLYKTQDGKFFLYGFGGSESPYKEETITRLAANKVKGIRCCCCSDYYSAKMTRAHNDANMLAIGGRVIAPETAKVLVEVFMTTEFEGGRHQRRVDQITAIENGQELE